jgi:hypothetical protein
MFSGRTARLIFDIAVNAKDGDVWTGSRDANSANYHQAKGS